MDRGVDHHHKVTEIIGGQFQEEEVAQIREGAVILARKVMDHGRLRNLWIRRLRGMSWIRNWLCIMQNLAEIPISIKNYSKIS